MHTFRFRHARNKLNVEKRLLGVRRRPQNIRDRQITTVGMNNLVCRVEAGSCFWKYRGRHRTGSTHCAVDGLAGRTAEDFDALVVVGLAERIDDT